MVGDHKGKLSIMDATVQQQGSSSVTSEMERLEQQQLELVDRTVARLGLPDRAALVRLALEETDAAAEGGAK